MKDIKSYFVRWRSLVLKIVLVSVLLECFVCNFRFFESLAWKDQTFDILKEGAYSLSEGQSVQDGSLIVPIDTEGKTQLLIYDGDIEAENIFIKCRYLNTEGYDNTYVNIKFIATDEGNELEYYMTGKERTVSSVIPGSSYIRLHPAGRLHSLKLEFPEPINENMTGVEITELKFNVPVRFDFMISRVMIFILIGLLFAVIRPSSVLYGAGYGFDEDFPFKKALAFIVLTGTVAVSLIFINIDPLFRSPDYITEYHELAEAMLDGHFYLDKEPSEVIEEMDNPYDTKYRQQLLLDADEDKWDSWDYAYYDGKLYVYFGVVPMLLTILPFYAITGAHLPISIAISVFGMLYLVAAWLLLRQIFRRWFSKTPYILFLLSYLLLVFGSGIFYGYRRAAFYSLPILSGAAFAVLGLYFWLRADVSGESIDAKNVSLGSLMIALTAGCRPQLLLTAACAFPIFWKDIMGRRVSSGASSDVNADVSISGSDHAGVNECMSPDGSDSGSLKLSARAGGKSISAGRFDFKRFFKFVLALVIPALIIAVFAMYYNYARFGSVLDFGANYNLTSNDMTKRGWQWDRTGLGLFVYLFQPPRILGVFPFIYDTLASSNFTNYLGTTIIEDNYGGLIINHIILLLPLLPFVVKKYCDRMTAALGGVLTVSAFVIVVADTQMAGLLGRYMMDFGWMLTIASILIYMSIEKKSNDRALKWFIHAALIVSVIWGVVRETIMFLSFETDECFIDRETQLFYCRQDKVELWL